MQTALLSKLGYEDLNHEKSCLYQLKWFRRLVEKGRIYYIDASIFKTKYYINNI